MHIRSTFHHELGVLQAKVLREGSLVEGLIERAMDALQTLDSAGAHRVIEQDAEIDNLRFEIEGLAVQLIATQQPMASDLRIIIAALHMIVDLERMGDHAAGIAKIVLLHQGQPLVKPLIDLPRMAEIASRMLREALAAFAARDVAAARRVIREDDEIDQLYDQVYRELLTYMLSDPRTIDRATWLLWAAHNLERIADRATNICERVIFLVTGKMEKESVSGG